jgi:hypothetical protein
MKSELITEQAFLVTGDQPSIDNDRVGRLLDFFGIPYQTEKATDFRLREAGQAGSSTKCRLICAAETFAQVVEQAQNASHGTEGFVRRMHSVFLYPTRNVGGLTAIVSQLSGKKISIYKGVGNDSEWSIADDSGGVCGPMRGLRVRPATATVVGRTFFDWNGSSVTPLLAAGSKAAFLKLMWQTIPVFVSSTRLIDIDAELATPNFDVRDHLFSAVPAVAYIKWAFSHNGWRPPEPSACLVIDDPLLKARYGFVRFRELLTLMSRHRFSTSIAFIPWNWRRNNREVVQLFKDNPDKYSLCIHGCDHTAGEFGISDRQRLHSAASEASRRMSLHQRRTGLAHDRVMVFPQGVFSEKAIPELKRAGYHAVVNTEVHGNPTGERKLSISDVWDVAVMSYGDFPIYTRRYPVQGVENLAFDLLLGKPCLVVIHHDFCRDGYARLVQFIDQLNALKVTLNWRCLGDVVRRTYRQRRLSSDCVEIEMYGTELLIENHSGRAMSYFVRRRERDSNSIESLYAGSRCVPWKSAGDHIEFKVDLVSGESTLLRLVFKPADHVARRRQNLAHSAKIVLRRYLSEARDNYLMPAKARIAASLAPKKIPSLR